MGSAHHTRARSTSQEGPFTGSACGAPFYVNTTIAKNEGHAIFTCRNCERQDSAEGVCPEVTAVTHIYSFLASAVLNNVPTESLIGRRWR